MADANAKTSANEGRIYSRESLDAATVGLKTLGPPAGSARPYLTMLSCFDDPFQGELRVTVDSSLLGDKLNISSLPTMDELKVGVQQNTLLKESFPDFLISTTSSLKCVCRRPWTRRISIRPISIKGSGDVIPLHLTGESNCHCSFSCTQQLSFFQMVRACGGNFEEIYCETSQKKSRLTTKRRFTGKACKKKNTGCYCHRYPLLDFCQRMSRSAVVFNLLRRLLQVANHDLHAERLRNKVETI